MPQVPYQPYPDVAPTMQGAPEMRIQTPPAAFGSTVAAAVSAVGGDLNKVGDEMFARGMAIQDLQNHADADKAYQDFVEQQGALHERFNSLEGKARSDAYPQYIADTHALRDKVEATLTNPMAVRYYQSNSRSQAARMVFSGAVLAGEAFKQYQKENAVGEVGIATRNVSTDEYNPTTFEDSIKRAAQAAGQHAVLDGHTPGDAYSQDLTQKAVSQVAFAQIQQTMRNNPSQGEDLLNDFISRKLLYGNDINRAQQLVEGTNHSIAATNIADDIFTKAHDAQGKITQTVTDQIDQANKIVDEKFDGNAAMRQKLISTIKMKNAQADQIQKLDAWTAKQDLTNLIVDKGYHTEQELRADPNGAKILEGMAKQDKRFDVPAYRQALIDKTFKEANQQAFNEAKSQAYTNREGFYDMDFTKLPINKQQLVELEAFRSHMLKTGGDDPLFHRAIDIMNNTHGGQLSALNILSAKKDDPDLIRYHGALYSALTAWRETHGKPPSEAEIRDTVGPAVIQDIAVPRTFMHPLTTTQPLFKTEPPDDFKTKWHKDYPMSTNDQMYNDYNAVLYNKLFSIAPKSDKGAK